MQAKLKAEEANRAALEAERIAAKEAAEKEAAKASKANTSEVPQTEASGGSNSTSSRVENDKKNKSELAGICIYFQFKNTHAYLRTNISTGT